MHRYDITVNVGIGNITAIGVIELRYGLRSEARSLRNVSSLVVSEVRLDGLLHQ